VNSGPETWLGFSADLPWIRSQIFSRPSRELDQDSELTASLKVIPNTKSNPTEVGENVTELRVPFKTLFPFWQMLVPESFVRDRQGILRRVIVALEVSGLILFLVFGVVVVLLLRMDRLLKLSQSQSRLLNGVSHELKTPLALIWLYSEILLQENESYPKSERKVFCEIISRESERLTRLFEQLLSFGRIAGGQQRYHFREGDLNAEIALTVNTYAQHLKQRGFDVEMELDAQGSLTRFDSGAIRQVVLNLMDNARKYSGEAKFIGVRLRSQDHQVSFEVADHGIGIPIEEQEKIFREFYRYRVSQGPKRLGYGLGLFLVRHIMQAHGGKIELDSEVGRGSRFRLVFPVTTESKVEHRLAGSWPRRGCAKSLLRRLRHGAAS
jgi:signal transduction histidine kinase